MVAHNLPIAGEQDSRPALEMVDNLLVPGERDSLLASVVAHNLLVPGGLDSLLAEEEEKGIETDKVVDIEPQCSPFSQMQFFIGSLCRNGSTG